MRLEELSRLLRTTDPAAVLVPTVVMSRVIQNVTGLTWVLWRVPHSRCFVVHRSTLFQFVEPEELYLPSDHLLPETVLLLERPPAEQLAGRSGDLLTTYWRRLFHAAAHRELDARLAKADDAAIRKRVEVLGASAFEEAREVLTHDGHLPAGADDRMTYTEFAAFYLELRHFAANLVPVYFPSMPHPDAVERLLTKDLDGPVLFQKTRLPGSPDPVFVTDDLADESHDYFYRLRRMAERSSKAGDRVTAAITYTRAARVAPASLSGPSQEAAKKEVYLLVADLLRVLGFGEDESARWRAVLPVLLDKADQGNRPVEAALLYDLQRVCQDHAETTYTLDVIEWARSLGKKKIKRELTNQKYVRTPAHLRNANARLTAARLTEENRQALGVLLRAAVERAEEQLRNRFRPYLAHGLRDAGMLPTSHPEQAALAKTIEELLDRISAVGFLSFADLRDAIARGQMKLPDLAGRPEYLHGDSLLRLDARLATQLDGVYHRGEFYVRWLERLTSIAFGTTYGRWATRNVLLPFGGAFLVAQFVWLFVYERRQVEAGGLPEEPVGALAGGMVAAVVSSGPPPSFFGGWNAAGWFHLAWLALGVFLLLLVRSAGLRAALADAGRAAYRAGRFLFRDVPIRVWSHPSVRAFLTSGPFQLFVNYVVKPALLSAVVFVLVPWLWTNGNWVRALTVLGALGVVNSRLGQLAEALLFHTANALAQIGRSFPALIRLVSDIFRQFIDALEWALARGEDWLRLRGRSGPLQIASRAALSMVWFPVAFLVRFYLVVLIEPMINPLKLPLSVLFAKFVYPMLGLFGLFTLTPLGSPLVGQLSPYLTYPVAWLVVIGTFYLLPDAVTFLFWEMRENWRLYRANRPSALKPVPVGPHGETVEGLLHWGFHSGTLPKLYARLRAAEREAVATNVWREVRAYREALNGVVESVRRFVTRDLVNVLNPTPTWAGRSLRVGKVEVGTNRIRVELLSGADEPPAVLQWEDRSGWLVAGWVEPGWLPGLSPSQVRVMTDALAYLYKRAGVHLVREHVRAVLPPSAVRFDVVSAGLVAWYDDPAGPPVLYDLARRPDDLRPRTPDNLQLAAGPTLDGDRLLFTHVRLTWADWVYVWQADREGREAPRFGPSDFDLVLLPRVGDKGATPIALGPALSEIKPPEANGSRHPDPGRLSRPAT